MCLGYLRKGYVMKEYSEEELRAAQLCLTPEGRRLSVLIHGEMVDKVSLLRREGLSYTGISDVLGITRQRAHQIYTGYKSTYNPKQGSEHAKRVRQFIKASTLLEPELAKKYGIKVTRKGPVDKELVMYLRESGYTYKDIAERFGVSFQRIQQIVKRIETCKYSPSTYRYSKSPKRKATQKRYEETEKGKKVWGKYTKSPKFKAAQRRAYLKRLGRSSEA